MGVVITTLGQGMAWILKRVVATAKSPQQTIRVVMQISWVLRGQKTKQNCGMSLNKETGVPGHLIFDLLFQNKNHLGEPGAEGSGIAEAEEF
jgi:hypothetical protein